MSGLDMDELRRAAADLVAQPLGERVGYDAAALDGSLAMADRELEAGRSGKALRLYAAMVLMDPRRPEPQLGLSRAALAEGRHEMALQAASQVVAAHPRHPEGWLLSGAACLGMGEHEAAREDFTTAAELARSGPVAEAARRALAGLGSA